MLYPGSRFRMADELLETYLRQLIEAHASVPQVTVAWQGGEPTLMGVDFVRRSVELTNRYLNPGQRAGFTIQTNGTLIDEEWAAEPLRIVRAALCEQDVAEMRRDTNRAVQRSAMPALQSRQRYGS
jgi:MoaA/NifB/PqqE/SkfB family radical SAM enzyme